MNFNLSIKPKRSLVFLSVLYLAFVPALSFGTSESESANKTIRLLTIGNSFADNSLRYLEDLVTSEGKTIEVFRANLGGATLERHAGHLQKYVMDPHDPDGKPYGKSEGNEKKISLIEALESNNWDIVTIQQASFKSFIWETYEPFASQLIETIREHAPTATIMIHQTWAYRVDDPWFTNEKVPHLPQTQEQMYNALLACYTKLAKKHDLSVIPVGMAFQITRALPEWEFHFPDAQFDYQNPDRDAVPVQLNSLNVGWRWGKNWKTGEIEFGMDGHHANQNGEYLGACVFYEVLFGDSLDKKSVWYPESIPAESATLLRKAAHTAVLLNPFKANCRELSFQESD